MVCLYGIHGVLSVWYMVHGTKVCIWYIPYGIHGVWCMWCAVLDCVGVVCAVVKVCFVFGASM